jgi:hypothetical protein
VDGCRDNGSCDGVLAREADRVVVLEELIRQGGSSLPLLLSQGAAKLRCRSRGYVFYRLVDTRRGNAFPGGAFPDAELVSAEFHSNET